MSRQPGAGSLDEPLRKCTRINTQSVKLCVDVVG